MKHNNATNEGLILAMVDFVFVFCFLDAPSHLYKRVCPSVRRSVGPSVPRYFQTRTRRILCRVSGLVLFELPNILFLDVVEEAFSQLSPAHASSSVWITRLSLAHFRVIDQVCLLSLHSWQATHNWLTPPHSFNSQANYTWVNMNITTLERCQVDGNPAFDSNSFFNLAVLTTQRSSFTFQDRTFRGEFSLQACAIEPYLTVLPFQEEKKTKG